jgi:hypothetical protein
MQRIYSPWSPVIFRIPLASAIAENNVTASQSGVAVCIGCDGRDQPFARTAGESKDAIGGVERFGLEIHLRHKAVDLAGNLRMNVRRA